MKKSIKILLGLGLIVVLFLINSGYFRGKGYIPLVKMEDATIEIGTTTVQEVLDKGYTLEYSKAFEPVKTVPGKKYTSILFSFSKDGKNYGTFSIVNNSGEEKRTEECTIRSMRYYYTNPEVYYDGVSIDELVPKGLSLDQIKEKLGEPEKEDDSKLKYESKGGLCTIEYEFKDDKTLKTVTVEKKSK
ncbi:hypothetical protein KQI86_15195 [Clostridium sp. MSJ-11]|uniref:Uncharacterized protein n=1 Tax=Clostridium mobile TaxID=2841512 RepID=A0ABS6EMQ5_9CLOT|nr:hypothetical protein [Clostridium mobile]MBU5485664.1 hypothetical protein [Clostridium mobile]